MLVLFLDDDPGRWELFKTSCPYKAVLATTATACIRQLKYRKFDMVFLDHDLDNKIFVNPEDENTGSEVVRWLEANPIDEDTEFIVHTLNEPAGLNMVRTLRNLGYVAHYRPFGSTFSQDRENLVTALCTKTVPGMEGAVLLG